MNRETCSLALPGWSTISARMPVKAEGKDNRNGPVYRRLVGNIERAIAEFDVLQKELAYAAGLSETTFSQKLRGIRSHFYVDELEPMAEWLRKKTGRPLVAFPHLEWAMMELADRKVYGWRPTPK